MRLFGAGRSCSRSRAACRLRRRDRLAQLRAADDRRRCAARSCSSTSGPTPASTGCARSPTSAPGPSGTRRTAWSWSACTRPSSPSSTTSTTSRRAVAEMRHRLPGRDRQTTTRSGARSRTTTGRPSTSWTPKGASATTSSARASTSECEMVIQQLLREAGARASARSSSTVEPEGFEVQADWATSSRPRPTSATSRRRTSPPRRPARRAGDYAAPDRAAAQPVGARRRLDRRPRRGQAERRRGPDRVPVPRARRPPRDGPGDAREPVPFRVLLDGEPPGDAHGFDVDELGHGTLVEQRLHQLIRQPGRIERAARSRSSSSTPGAEALLLHLRLGAVRTIERVADGSTTGNWTRCSNGSTACATSCAR